MSDHIETLKQVRELLQRTPELQSRAYVQLGIAFNDAIAHFGSLRQVPEVCFTCRNQKHEGPCPEPQWGSPKMCDKLLSRALNAEKANPAPPTSGDVRGEATGDTPTFLETWMKLTTRDRAIISQYFHETAKSPPPTIGGSEPTPAQAGAELPYIADDLDIMRDVYMNSEQRAAFARIVKIARRGGS